MQLPVLISSSSVPSCLAGLVLGAAFGAMAQRTHFCTMGAVSDAVLFGSLRRLRVWALGAGSALIATQGLVAVGVLGLDTTAYRAPVLPWLGSGLGGLVFGFGMVLAGGCASRVLVRLGGGSLKALLVVLVMALVAATVAAGVLAWLPHLVQTIGTVPLPGGVPGLDGLVPAWLTVVVVGGGLVAFGLREKACRTPTADAGMSLVLACTVVLGWVATTSLAPAPPASLTFIVPAAQSLGWLMGGSGVPGFAIASIFGVILGSMAAAAAAGRLRLETFTSRDDMIRHVLGGALMGVGGVLAGGCTIGLGVTGVSALGPAAFIGVAAILAGAVWALRWLETGRLWPLRAGSVRPSVG